MSVVAWQAAGRTSLRRRRSPGLDSLAAWHPGPGPVPVTMDVLAEAAMDDGAVALIVDAAGPAPLVLESDLLTPSPRVADWSARGRRIRLAHVRTGSG